MQITTKLSGIGFDLVKGSVGSEQRNNGLDILYARLLNMHHNIDPIISLFRTVVKVALITKS
jgi:hypothetical protein